MNDGTVKLDDQHDQLVKWGTKQLVDIIKFMDASQIEQFLNRNIMGTSAEIEVAFAELLDMTNAQTKEFLFELISRKNRIASLKAQQKRLLEQAKKNQELKKKQKMQSFKSVKREK